MLRSRRRVSRTETTSFLRATGFSTISSRSGLARASRLLSLAVGLWKEIVLLWLVGLGVIQALVGPVSRGGDGGVKLSLGRESCVMACRGSSRVLGVLGITRPARYAGAFTSFLPSRIRHPHRGVDWYSGLRARSINRSRVANTAGALEASKTPARARSSGSATKISNRKSGGTKARATTAKKTSPSSSTGANIGADSRSVSLDCSPRKVLVIVESPAKARTISGILEKACNRDGSSMNFGGYTVDACNGHVRDLVGKRKDVPPELKERTKKWDVIGVDVENSFEPLYIPNPAKKAIVNRLKKAASKSDEIILATDEDREGEAISWHLLQVLQPTVPVKRAVFHEITQEALTKAFENPGEIDHNLVQAQEARRILDRLAGFTLTPVVWSLVAPGLSAGRVQSVALAMVVERERKRLLFKPAEYWDVVANVTAAVPTAAGGGKNGERLDGCPELGDEGQSHECLWYRSPQ